MFFLRSVVLGIGESLGFSAEEELMKRKLDRSSVLPS